MIRSRFTQRMQSNQNNGNYLWWRSVWVQSSEEHFRKWGLERHCPFEWTDRLSIAITHVIACKSHSNRNSHVHSKCIPTKWIANHMVAYRETSSFEGKRIDRQTTRQTNEREKGSLHSCSFQSTQSLPEKKSNSFVNWGKTWLMRFVVDC